MSNKAFYGIVAVIVIIAVGGAVLFSRSDDSSDKNKITDVAAVTETDHTKGNSDATVTLIEYGDYQCPYCGILHPTVEEILDEYEEDILFVFRHFPLTNIHQNALTAHRAAEAAGKQDKFFEMHDLLYERQTAWSESDEPITVFTDYAEELGLNIDQFEKDLQASDVAERVRSDKKGGEDAGVESTPTLFLNGEKIDAPRSTEEFREIIDEALKDASSNNGK